MQDQLSFPEQVEKKKITIFKRYDFTNNKDSKAKKLGCASN
jgi:hypothetical protein